MRMNGRKPDELRPVRIIRNFIKHAEGSVLIQLGETRVICTATLEDKVPPFLRNQGRGWITAEYAMLPRSTKTRSTRESTQGRVGGRTHEIQRLIGRSLRAVMDLSLIGERTFWIDCDVIQADGGTRTASITGAYVALVDAVECLRKEVSIPRHPIIDSVAAISIGVVDGQTFLDLNYEEDSKAEVDCNFVMTGRGRFIEIQGTAEGQPFSKESFEKMMVMAAQGIDKLTAIQHQVLNP
ncbi:MAG: ribonuclease PH [Thermodesulfobacteriota bacterium]|jgi:ribonuclease PH